MRFLGAKIHDGYGLLTAPAEEHTRIRRLFSHAFSNSALRQQERLLVKYVDLLIHKLDGLRESRKAINMVDMLNFVTFDIMAELTFGETLHLLETGKHIPWVHAIFDGLKFIVWRAVMLDIPILGSVLESLTTVPLKKKMKEHCRLSEDMVDRRLEWDDMHKKPDIWSFVLRHQVRGKGLTIDEMYANAAMFLIAGSETTSTSLSGVLFYLMTNPLVYEQLVGEIRSTFKSSADISLRTVSGMRYLNAVLQEGLRIYTPGGVGIARFVPSGGAEICGDYIPEGTLVSLNTCAAYTSATNFYRPRDFLPERWLYPDHETFRSDKREVFEPFSYGPRNCIGKKYVVTPPNILFACLPSNVNSIPQTTNWPFSL
jgi:cytochrome P450